MKYYIVIFCISFNLLVSAKVNIISHNGFQGRGFPSSKMMYENAVAIKEKIENFNIMFFGKNMAQNLELNPEDPDPKGYVCETTPDFAYELEYDEEILCFNKSVPMCAKTKVIKYKSLKQEKCEPRYKYDCYIDMIETQVTMQMRICNKVPKRDCDDLEGGHIVCETNYETVCETIYHQKNVSESKPECKTVTEPMCMMSSSGIETCLDMTKKVCKSSDVTVLKVIPQTGCEQVETVVCGNSLCPLKIEEICEDKEKTITTETPEEKCEIKSHKFCQPIYVLVPYIESEEACKNVEQEFCELRRVNPTKVMKQKLKKYCTKLRPPKK